MGEREGEGDGRYWMEGEGVYRRGWRKGRGNGGEEKVKEECIGYGMEGRRSREGDGGGNWSPTRRRCDSRDMGNTFYYIIQTLRVRILWNHWH